MQIGYFVYEYPPRIVGGLGTYAGNICPELARQGHKVSVYTMNDGTLKEQEALEGVNIHRTLSSNTFPVKIPSEIKSWEGVGYDFFRNIAHYNITAMANFLSDKTGDYDLVCIHDWLSGNAGQTIKNLTDLPVVFHLHSTEWGRSFGGGSETVTKFERDTATVADKVITVSFPMKEDLVNHGFDGNKIEVVWNGVYLERYNPDKISLVDKLKLRDTYGIGHSDKLILFVGRLTGVKGVMQLVGAMPEITKRHPDARLIVLGTGELENNVSDLINKLNLNNYVKTRFEFVSEDERILHYAASDIVVLPSLYEPFGIVSLEAMAMEKPVVVGASGISGFRDQIKNGETGIHVDGNKSEDIAWGINTLLDDMDKVTEMGKKGRKRVEEEFTWEKIAKKTIEVYADAARK